MTEEAYHRQRAAEERAAAARAPHAAARSAHLALAGEHEQAARFPERYQRRAPGSAPAAGEAPAPPPLR